MQADRGFHELMLRVRQGEERAAEELVSHFGPFVHRVVRTWLRSRANALRRSFDSLDICQSVLAKFFAKVRSGSYEVTRPEEVARLLGVMARNRVRKAARKQFAVRRDLRRSESLGPIDLPNPTGSSPSGIVASQDLWEEIRRQLTTEEWEVAQRRREGQGWAEIAAALGGTSDGRRMQLARAMQRFTSTSGLGPADLI
jgi:RNA polymerase sigma-70 factor (ECF subfamily)